MGPEQRARVPHIGTYRRELPESLERLYENAIDWEHLPYLHRTSFAKIECIDAGQWGFRARVWGQPYHEPRSFVIELKLSREYQRWITRELEGQGAGSEIWTHAFPAGERSTTVLVDFFVPGADPDRAPELAGFYRSLYARLYDEDVWMMSERQAQLDVARSGARRHGPRVQRLGQLSELRARLPLTIEMNGMRFRIVESGGELVAHSAVCAHMLGPLHDAPLENGIIECPWHGYRFDIRTRQCVSGARCSLAPAPAVSIDPKTAEVSIEMS